MANKESLCEHIRVPKEIIDNNGDQTCAVFSLKAATCQLQIVVLLSKQLVAVSKSSASGLQRDGNLLRN